MELGFIAQMRRSVAVVHDVGLDGYRGGAVLVAIDTRVYEPLSQRVS